MSIKGLRPFFEGRWMKTMGRGGGGGGNAFLAGHVMNYAVCSNSYVSET